MRTNEELLAEITKLRSEMAQLREVVNALFNAVFDDMDEDIEAVPQRNDDFNIYN